MATTTAATAAATAATTAATTVAAKPAPAPATLRFYTTKPRAMPLPGARITGNGVAVWPVPMALMAGASANGPAALPKGIWCSTIAKVAAGGNNGTMQSQPIAKGLPAGAVAYTPACAATAWAACQHPASGLTPAQLATLRAWAQAHALALLAAPAQAQSA